MSKCEKSEASASKSKFPKLPSFAEKLSLPKSFKLPANLNLQTIMDYIQDAIKAASSGSMPTKPTGPSRHMKFPYTYSAKIAQFPYKFYYENNWIARFYPLGILVSLPIFWYISRLSNSPGNVEKWKEIKRKEKEEHHHRFDE